MADDRPPTISFPNGPPDPSWYPTPERAEAAMRNYEAELAALAAVARPPMMCRCGHPFDWHNTEQGCSATPTCMCTEPVPRDTYHVIDPGAPGGPGPRPLPIVVVYARPHGELRRRRVILEIGEWPFLEEGSRDSLGGEGWTADRSEIGKHWCAVILGEALMRTVEVLDNRAPSGHILGGPRRAVDGPNGQPLIEIDLGDLPASND